MSLLSVLSHAFEYENHVSAALLDDGSMPRQRGGSWFLPVDNPGCIYLRVKQKWTAAWGPVHATSEIRRVIKETTFI